MGLETKVFNFPFPPCLSDCCTTVQIPVWASLVAQRLKHLPGMRETRVWSLGREDPLEKEMATHSSILAWRIPWREEPGRLQSMGSQRVGHDWETSLHFTDTCTIQKHVWLLFFSIFMILPLFQICCSCQWYQSSRLQILVIMTCSNVKFKQTFLNISYLLSHFSHVWLCATP